MEIRTAASFYMAVSSAATSSDRQTGKEVGLGEFSSVTWEEERGGTWTKKGFWAFFRYEVVVGMCRGRSALQISVALHSQPGAVLLTGLLNKCPIFREVFCWWVLISWLGRRSLQSWKFKEFIIVVWNWILQDLIEGWGVGGEGAHFTQARVHFTAFVCSWPPKLGTDYLGQFQEHSKLVNWSRWKKEHTTEHCTGLLPVPWWRRVPLENRRTHTLLWARKFLCVKEWWSVQASVLGNTTQMFYKKDISVLQNIKWFCLQIQKALLQLEAVCMLDSQ